jgi:hypothetical protein
MIYDIQELIMGKMRRCLYAFFCFCLCLAGLSHGIAAQKTTDNPSFSEAIPRRSLEFLLVAELRGVKGKYERRIDVSENTTFHITDHLGKVSWKTAGRMGKIEDGKIHLHLWLTWTLKRKLAGFSESDVVLEIGQDLKPLPDGNAALKASASIRRIEDGGDDSEENTDGKHHQGRRLPH